jgi:hypothetical protein
MRKRTMSAIPLINTGLQPGAVETLTGKPFQRFFGRKAVQTASSSATRFHPAEAGC